MQDWIRQVTAGQELTAHEAERAFRAVVEGDVSDAELAAFLTALRTRGEAPQEVAGGVRALRGVMVEVELPAEGLVDTCGTGGGSVTTFNISTVSALVAAGGGVGVAKHGNRSYSSRCGSADVLEELGVAVELGPDALAGVYEEAGMVFMYAPRFHPAMRHVAPVRRELGVRTVMNVLGPLTSPARVRRQVVGVADPELVELIGGALSDLGHEHALVVHGEPGLDELSPLGPTRGVEVRGDRVEPFELDPADFGWEGLDPDDLAGGSPAENAALTRRVLRGEERGAARAAVELNAAAAFYVSGAAESLEEGRERARSSLESGAAWGALERLRAATRRRAGGGQKGPDGAGGPGPVSTSG